MRRSCCTIAITLALAPSGLLAQLVVRAEDKVIFSDPLVPTESYVDVYLDVGDEAPPLIAGFQASVELFGGTGIAIIRAPICQKDR